MCQKKKKMPLSTKCWAFRVDIDPTKKSEFNTTKKNLKKFLLENKSEWSLCVLEDVKGANHHLQGMCLLSQGTLKDTALRARFKKSLVPAASGNGSYSLKKLAPDEDPNFPFLEMEKYLMKGPSADELPTIVSRGTTLARYSADRIDELHKLYWDTAAALTKKRKVRMYDEVLRKVKSQRIERREDIARCVISELADQEKVISINGVRGLVNLIYYKVAPDPVSAMTVLLELVMERN